MKTSEVAAKLKGDRGRGDETGQREEEVGGSTGGGLQLGPDWQLAYASASASAA